MKKFTNFITGCCLIIGVMGCQHQKTGTSLISVQNNSVNSLPEVLIKVDITKLKTGVDFSEPEKIMVKAEEQLPYQLSDVDKDGKVDRIFILCDLKPGEKKEINISKASSADEVVKFDKRTYAEIAVKEGGEWVKRNNGNEQYEYKGGKFVNINYLKVPEQHTAYSFYIKYDGPGWESDKIGYRFYL